MRSRQPVLGRLRGNYIRSKKWRTMAKCLRDNGKPCCTSIACSIKCTTICCGVHCDDPTRRQIDEVHAGKGFVEEHIWRDNAPGASRIARNVKLAAVINDRFIGG